MGGLVILGGGLAGLGCALSYPGAKIFEAKSHFGGRAYSYNQGGVCFDQGAHISHTKNDSFIKLTTEAAKDIVTFSQSRVRNYWKGSWMTYPIQNHLHELPTELRIKAITDLVQAHLDRTDTPPANYREWCEAQYGQFLTDNFYRVFTEKYWRSTMESMSIDWLGGRLLPSQLPRILAGVIASQEEQQAAFARFRYPIQGGFFGLFESLYDNVDVTCGRRACEIDPKTQVVHFEDGSHEYYEHLASSIPLPHLIRLVKDAPTEIVEAADKLHATQMLCVNMIVNRDELTDAHWFYIYDSDIDVARVSLPGNLSPASVPAGKTALQAEIYRHDTETLNPEQLVLAAQQQVGKVLGFDASDVEMLDHVHLKQAYIISDANRAAIVDMLLEWLEEREIHSMGLYGRWKYVWSDVAFTQGQQTANKIKGQYHAAA